MTSRDAEHLRVSSASASSRKVPQNREGTTRASSASGSRSRSTAIIPREGSQQSRTLYSPARVSTPGLQANERRDAPSVGAAKSKAVRRFLRGAPPSRTPSGDSPSVVSAVPPHLPVLLHSPASPVVAKRQELLDTPLSSISSGSPCVGTHKSRAASGMVEDTSSVRRAAEAVANTSTNNTRVKPQRLKSFHRSNTDDALGVQLFELVARTPGGRHANLDEHQDQMVRFTDFARLHRSVLNLGANLLGGVVPATQKLGSDSPQHLEHQFRKYDADLSFGLDRNEWSCYARNLISAFGKHRWNDVCKGLIREHQFPNVVYDQQLSERLLMKICNAQHVGQQHMQEIEGLLHKRADPNFVDAVGQTIFGLSIQKADASVVECLLGWQGDPIMTSWNKDSAVLIAARARRFDVLPLFLFEKIALNKQCNQDFEMSAALVANMASLQEKEIRDLISKNADVNYRSDQGWTPLISAVFLGRRECVECLIRTAQALPKIKLHIDVRDVKGRTALHVAARKGRVDLVRLLIGAKASVDVQDADGWTPVHHAVFNSHSDCLIALFEFSASMCIGDHQGITACMLKAWPDQLRNPLNKKATELLEPCDAIQFSKHILPILKSDALTVSDKLDMLLSLPGVSGRFEKLRLYDQVFDMRKGPNVPRLTKFWDHLGRELLLRLRSGETDLHVEASRARSAFSTEGDMFNENCSGLALELTEQAAEERDRRILQRRFLVWWLTETGGPPRSADWTWDNREGYRSELETLARGELEAFRLEGLEVRASLVAQPGGERLSRMQADEVIRDDCITQLGAHPILAWLDCTDACGAFWSLCQVRAFGIGAGTGCGNGREAIVGFISLLTTDRVADLGGTSQAFWQNVYKLWLSAYALLADADFQAKMRSFAAAFNEDEKAEGLKVLFEPLPPKTYDDLRAEEWRNGVLKKKGGPTEDRSAQAPGNASRAGWRSFDERTTVATSTDVIRCRMVANSPLALVKLVEAFRSTGLSGTRKERFELVRIRNGFNSSAETIDGCHHILLNVLFRGGEARLPDHLFQLPNRSSGVADRLPISLVGEIRLTLPDFRAAEERVKPIVDFLNGDYEPRSCLSVGDGA